MAAEVPGRHVRAAGERLDVQWLRVLPVDPVADAAQPREGELETRRQFDCYPRLYGPMAVPSVVLSFLPLLEDVIEKADGVTTTTWRYGTPWEMAAVTAVARRPPAW
jgi:hypothetical protein